MVIIRDGKQENKFLSSSEYYQGKGLAAKIIMLFTKQLRAHYVGNLIKPKESHLDIGCGDGYFIKRSPCQQVFGMDKKYGDIFTGKLHFADQYFDYVTMLAAIEHLDIDPAQIFFETYRVLKHGGYFIFTTPKKSASPFIRLCAPDVKQQHCKYYSYELVKAYSRGLFCIYGYKTFLFGLNQLYCLKKE